MIKKSILWVFFLFLNHFSLGCGGGSWHDDECCSHYQLFDPFDLQQQSSHQNYSKNVLLWSNILKDWKPEKISHVLHTTSEEEYESIWSNGNKTPLELASKRYIDFARKCSKEFEYRHYHLYSWDYERILKNQLPDFERLLVEANSMLNSEINAQLKSRYVYQIVRIFHYSKQYKEAIDFFNQNAHQFKGKSEIYYYTLDHVAGCYYSLKEFEKAAYLFLQVFDKSGDKKGSAFLSYNFCTNQGAEGTKYFESEGDEIAHLLIRSSHDFSDSMEDIRRLYDLDPSNENIESMFIEEIFDLESKLLPKHSPKGLHSLPITNTYHSEKAQDMLNFAEILSSDSGQTKSDFWQLAKSYLSFLNNDIAKAISYLSAIDEEKYQKQKQTLGKVYTILSWKSIDSEKEDFLADMLTEQFFTEQFTTGIQSGANFLIQEHVIHLYSSQNNLAKAFLVGGEFVKIEDIPSIDLINQLMIFINKSEKNRFETILRVGVGFHKDSLAIDYLNFLKGHYHLRKGQPQLALPLLKGSYYDQSPIKNDEYLTEQKQLVAKVSSKVFSNNIQECFACNEEEVMLDSVYLSKIFNFIEPKMTKSQLALSLLRLDSLTNDSKSWKRKLAHYLLGNFYFNTSNTGYFRDILRGFIYREYYYGHSETYFGLAEKAIFHYNKALENSSDRELNARCLYMMAKCELNQYYQKEDVYSYDGITIGKAAEYKVSFKKLNDEYEKTQFYEMLIDECSYFRNYSSIYNFNKNQNQE